MATDKKKITVYRVENSTRTGPYHANLWMKLWLYGPSKTDKWKATQKALPGFRQDFPTAGVNYASATLREKDLDLWFGEFKTELDKEGYVLASYLTDDYIMGKSGAQVAFNTLTAKPLGKKKLL